MEIFGRLIEVELVTLESYRNIFTKNAIVANYSNKNVHNQIFLEISDITDNQLSLFIENNKFVVNKKNVVINYAQRN